MWHCIPVCVFEHSHTVRGCECKKCRRELFSLSLPSSFSLCECGETSLLWLCVQWSRQVRLLWCTYSFSKMYVLQIYTLYYHSTTTLAPLAVFWGNVGTSCPHFPTFVYDQLSECQSGQLCSTPLCMLTSVCVCVCVLACVCTVMFASVSCCIVFSLARRGHNPTLCIHVC